MTLDLKLLICSYFELEEVLDLNHQIRDLILRRYKYQFPSWNEIFKSNNYQVAKYMMELKSYPNFSISDQPITDNLEMLKLLYSCGYKYTINDLNISADQGCYEVFLYLITLGINHTNKTLKLAEQSYDIIDDYNLSVDDQDEIPLDGYEKIIKYLKNK